MNKNPLIQNLVNRFLSWTLPNTVSSDFCVTDQKYPHPRTGTNLMTADEARQMFEAFIPEVIASERERMSLAAGKMIEHCKQSTEGREALAYWDTMRSKND